MKSIGEHLKNAREEKGFSFDQVVHDTNITREYIHALEEDNFDFFPAEAYLIGFLRNYSEYLGLDPSKMVSIYRNFKISEEPVPMDLLLGKKKAVPEKKEINGEDSSSQRALPSWLIAVVAAGIILGGGSAFFIPRLLSNENDSVSENEVGSTVQEAMISEPKEFFLTEETLDVSISDGDRINVSTGTRLVSFNTRFDEEGIFLDYRGIDDLQNEFELVEEAEQVVRIDEGRGVYFFVKDISASVVTLVAQKVSVDEETEEEDGLTVVGSSEESIAAEEAITTQTEDVTSAQSDAIHSASYPESYDVDVFFRGDGILRYKNDNNAVSEKYYRSGERLKIDVNRTVTLWISNAGIVDVKISGKEINPGGNGQVVVRNVKWIKNNETGKYELVIVPLD